MTAANPIRVVCVDDSFDVAHLLRVRINNEPNLRCEHVFTEPRSFLDWLAGIPADARPAVVLLDWTIHGMTAAEVIRSLEALQHAPPIRVLVCSGHDETVLEEQAAAAGACGVVSKNREIDGILSAIYAVARGEVVFPGR